MSKKMLNDLKQLGKEYQADIQANTQMRKGVEYYFIRKSKHIIDKIDRLICPLYGLTKQETEFIINYDLQFRTDD